MILYQCTDFVRFSIIYLLQVLTKSINVSILIKVHYEVCKQHWLGIKQPKHNSLKRYIGIRHEYCFGSDGKDKIRGLVQERLEVRKKVEKNTAAKKTVEKKAVSAVKAVEPEVKVEEKTEIKAEEAASEAKPEVQEAVSEVKAEEKPEAAAKKAVKPAAKKLTKAAAKKEVEAKTTKAATVSQKIILQMSGRDDLSMESIIERVKKAYADEGHSAASIKNIEVYIKPEEGMAYYVIDGYASGIGL